MKTFVNKYIIPSSIPLEVSKTSFGTQIMLPRQFVDFLEQVMNIPTVVGVISVYGSQEEARCAEWNTSVHNRQVHVIDEAEGSEVMPETE
jgi:protein tyrosine phosphatase